jgi:uncharacterized protein (TIGR00730 family)
LNICIYGASSEVIDAKYMSETQELGRVLAKKGYTLVFGGGAQGLMGAAARGFKEMNGRIIGIAPTFFMNVDGVLYDQCSQFIYTETMRERKQLMEEHSDAFLVTPGGIGTFEEFFEILTLKQLGRHAKPILIYNIFGYFDSMKVMMENAIEQKFMKDTCRELYVFVDTPEDVVAYLEQYKAPAEATRYYKNI